MTMTIKDFARYQYDSIRNSYSYNMVEIDNRQQSQKASDDSRVNQVSRTNSDSLQFLNQYKSEMDGLKSAAGKIRSLSKDSVWANLKISSSDEAIVSNATEYGKVPQRAQYDIDVLQLAKRQISQIAAQDIDSSQDGNLMIRFTDGDGNTVAADIQFDPTDDKTNILHNIADQINQYESRGIRASLVEDDAGTVTSIMIEGDQPGAGKGFTIDGIHSENIQEAQDLIYTLNGETHTSGSNHNIQIDPSGDNKFLRLNFDGLGKATIRADVDTEKLAKYTEKFVETYNQTIDFLVDHAHRGSAVSDTLDRFMKEPLDSDTMAKIGLHFGGDGKITFEADEFQKAMEKDIRKVYDVLADNYSVADTIYQRTDKASRASVASLLDRSQLQGSNGGVFTINHYHYYMAAPSPFYPSFFYPGSLFFNAKI